MRKKLEDALQATVSDSNPVKQQKQKLQGQKKATENGKPQRNKPKSAAKTDSAPEEKAVSHADVKETGAFEEKSVQTTEAEVEHEAGDE